MPKAPHPRFAYERAIMSERGPKSGISRLVAMVIAAYSDAAGKAWPSTRTIAASAAISERAAIPHIQKLVDGGWLTREKARGEGKQWARATYWLTIPAFDGAERGSSPASPMALNDVQRQTLDGTERGSSPEGQGGNASGSASGFFGQGTEPDPEGAEPRSDGTEPGANGAERHDEMALNDVQSNKTLNLKKNIKANTNCNNDGGKPLSDFLPSTPEQTTKPRDASGSDAGSRDGNGAPETPPAQGRGTESAAQFAERTGNVRQPGETVALFHVRMLGLKYGRIAAT